MANTKREQHARPRVAGRRDGARNRRNGRVFASDDRSAVKQRDTARREQRRLERGKADRAQRFAERLAEVPASDLSPYEHYRREIEKRRGRGLPLLRPIDEHRRRAGVPVSSSLQDPHHHPGERTMSWWISYSSKDDFANDVRATGSVADADVTDEAKDQIKAARDAAQSIIDGGAVGADGKDFTVSLNGHANAGHEPAPGWANDCVGVNVTQKS